MSEKIFNAANKLNGYSATIGSVNLVKESIMSMEITYQNNTPVVQGRLIVEDIVDLNMQLVWRDELVEIYYNDMFNEEVRKTFVITNVTELYDDKFKKVFALELQDQFSHVLENSYLTKGFKSNVGTVLKAYIAELGLGDFKTDIAVITGSEEFVVPRHVNNLDFFLGELYDRGYTFYQTKDTIYVKALSSLTPITLTPNDLLNPFKNETDNQLYKNKIINLSTQFMRRGAVLPVTKSIAYDPLTKQIKSEDDNKNLTLSLGDDLFNLQDTSNHGTREITQSHLDFDQHKIIMRDSFMQQAELEMVVNGYTKNDVNQVYDLQLKGNLGSPDTQIKGNMIVAGKYVSHTVIDKIVGDTMIQKIHLSRANMNMRKI